MCGRKLNIWRSRSSRTVNGSMERRPAVIFVMVGQPLWSFVSRARAAGGASSLHDARGAAGSLRASLPSLRVSGEPRLLWLCLLVCESCVREKIKPRLLVPPQAVHVLKLAGAPGTGRRRSCLLVRPAFSPHLRVFAGTQAQSKTRTRRCGSHAACRAHVQRRLTGAPPRCAAARLMGPSAHAGSTKASAQQLCLAVLVLAQSKARINRECSCCRLGAPASSRRAEQPRWPRPSI